MWVSNFNNKDHKLILHCDPICTSGQVVRALDCCAKHRWFEPNPRIKVGMLAHCPPTSKWVLGGNTREVKGGEERNWPPYLIMPMAQDKCPSNGHSPNVRNRIWDSPLPFSVNLQIFPYICLRCGFLKLILSLQTLSIIPMNAMFLEYPGKELIAEFLSQWI